MKLTIILSIMFIAFCGCNKEVKIEDPHFKELIGTWSTVSDTEKQTVIVSEDGKITILHSAERGLSSSIPDFKYGNNFIVVDGDTLKSYNCYVFYFYKKENVDSAYAATTEKIDNQTVVGGRSLFVKTK